MEVQQILEKIWKRLGGNINAVKEVKTSIDQQPNGFLKDGVLTDVSEDTVTPGNSEPLPVKIISSLTAEPAPSLIATHRSPEDFNAAYTSNVTITLSGHPSITNSAQIVYIKQVKADDTSVIYINGAGGVTMTYAANVITIHDAGTPFAAGDVYEVGLNLQNKAYDLSLDILKIIEQSPEKSWWTDVESVVTGADVGAVDGVYVLQGNEIDVRDNKTLVIGQDITISNSTGVSVKFMGLLESGGKEYGLVSTTDYIVDHPDADSDPPIISKFDVTGVQYVKIYTKADDVDTGGGTIATIDLEITKQY